MFGFDCKRKKKTDVNVAVKCIKLFTYASYCQSKLTIGVYKQKKIKEVSQCQSCIAALLTKYGRKTKLSHVFSEKNRLKNLKELHMRLGNHCWYLGKFGSHS